MSTLRKYVLYIPNRPILSILLTPYLLEIIILMIFIMFYIALHDDKKAKVQHSKSYKTKTEQQEPAHRKVEKITDNNGSIEVDKSVKVGENKEVFRAVIIGFKKPGVKIEGDVSKN